MKKMTFILAPLALVAGIALAQTTTKTPATKPAPTIAATNCVAVLKAKVNINKAPLEQMKCLPGFVTSIANDVILNRPYKDGKEFMIKIEVTGKKLWPKIEQYVVFK